MWKLQLEPREQQSSAAAAKQQSRNLSSRISRRGRVRGQLLEPSEPPVSSRPAHCLHRLHRFPSLPNIIERKNVAVGWVTYLNVNLQPVLSGFVTLSLDSFGVVRISKKSSDSCGTFSVCHFVYLCIKWPYMPSMAIWPSDLRSVGHYTPVKTHGPKSVFGIFPLNFH